MAKAIDMEIDRLEEEYKGGRMERFLPKGEKKKYPRKKYSGEAFIASEKLKQAMREKKRKDPEWQAPTDDPVEFIRDRSLKELRKYPVLYGAFADLSAECIKEAFPHKYDEIKDLDSVWSELRHVHDYWKKHSGLKRKQEELVEDQFLWTVKRAAELAKNPSEAQPARRRFMKILAIAMTGPLEKEEIKESALKKILKKKRAEIGVSREEITSGRFAGRETWELAQQVLRGDVPSLFQGIMTMEQALESCDPKDLQRGMRQLSKWFVEDEVPQKISETIRGLRDFFDEMYAENGMEFQLPGDQSIREFRNLVEATSNFYKRKFKEECEF